MESLMDIMPYASLALALGLVCAWLVPVVRDIWRVSAAERRNKP